MGGKGGSAPVDNSRQLYEQQQADLAAERAAREEQERLQREEEQRRRDELREQMLGSRNILGGAEDEEATVTQNVLG